MKTYLSQKFFSFCHGRHLVYNTCWEDPRLDRAAMKLDADDRVVVITSAGCNALDYALDEPARIDAVDVNPRQNALLELKLASVRRLDYGQFFEMFGRGRLVDFPDVYRRRLRQELSDSARTFWDRHGHMFLGSGRRTSFYFRGTAGLFAWVVNGYIDRVARIREDIDALLTATSLAEQGEIYFQKVKPLFWGPVLRWAMGRDMVLSMLGVPRAQRLQLDRYYPGGLVQFIEDRLDEVFARRPLAGNYFWRVYLTGQYTPDCCPDYLKPGNFHRLQAGLADRVHCHTASLLQFLRVPGEPITRFVLLDHMDWLAEHHQDVLRCQWQAIVDRASDGARILWRSAALQVEFIDSLAVRVNNQVVPVGELLTYHEELADRLHLLDRVNTYGSFAIADLCLPAAVLDPQRNCHANAGPVQNAILSNAVTDSW